MSNNFFNKYPYTDFHELNLDWILKKIEDINATLDDFVEYNEIKFHDPITWNITTQYTRNTIVTDGGVAYLSKQAVPAGIDISDSDYWLGIGVFDISVEDIKKSISVHMETLGQPASHEYNTGDLIWLGLNLNRAIANIEIGDSFSSSNIVNTSLEDELKAEATARTNTGIVDLLDVNISSLEVGQILVWDGEKFVNSDQAGSAAWGDITGDIQDQTDLDEELTDIRGDIANMTVGGLSDVTLSNIQIGQIIKWDGSKFINANESGGGGGGAIWGQITGALSNQTDLSTALSNKADADDLDEWSASATVASGNTVTFTGLDDSLGYELYSEDAPNATYSSVTKTGSGTSMQLVYIVSGSEVLVGTTKFYLRILK